MSVTNADIQKALRIKKTVKDFFEKSTETKIQAKELMPSFISNGIFTKDNQDGYPIRNFLRHLDENKSLHLIPQAHFEQKAQNKNWYFIKTNG